MEYQTLNNLGRPPRRKPSSLLIPTLLNLILLVAGCYIALSHNSLHYEVAAPLVRSNTGCAPAITSRVPSVMRRNMVVNSRQRSVDVLLKEDIRGTGKKGEITAVKPGFWRNYLLPQGLATQPTAEYLEELRLEDERKVAEAKAKKDAAIKLRDSLQILSFTIRVKAQDDGTLYGGVRAQDIVEVVKSQTGTELDAKTIDVPEITSLDTYTVYVNLHPEVRASFPLSVQRGK